MSRSRPACRLSEVLFRSVLAVLVATVLSPVWAVAETRNQPAAARQPWLDPEGKPLPFHSDEEVEGFLRTAEVLSSRKIGTGVTEPRKVLLQRHGIRAHAIFKDVDITRKGVERSHTKTYFDFRDHHINEVAAYIVDRLLGLNRVPPAVPRTIGRDSGTLQLWMEGTIMEVERREMNLLPPDSARWEQQRQMMALFDNLLGNTDSNLGNLLIDRQWNLWFIDHTRCFVKSKKSLYPERITQVERQMWQALLSMDEDAALDQLNPYLSRSDVKALLARRLELIAYVEGLFDQFGEHRVLFDLLPPSEEPYPWPE